MSENFWTSRSVEPKRNYRFKVEIAGIGSGAVWFAKSADKPKFDQDVLEHDFLNHKFKFPGRLKWSDVTVTLVDPVNPDAMSETLLMLWKAGYEVPTSKIANIGTMSKSDAVIEKVEISQLDADGMPLETWTLKNAFLKNAEFEKLDYGNEDMSTITLTFAYDWAECTFHGLAPDFAPNSA